MNEIILKDPLDMHLHVREGNILKQVVPYTSKNFSAAMIMPNTINPINTIYKVKKYRDEIFQAAGSDLFKPYMTLYFESDYTEEFLSEAKNHILAIKFYPKNLTTNSYHGCDPLDGRIDKILSIMENLEIPLSVHAEAPGYYLDRERLFHGFIGKWAGNHPSLKIIIEHISDRGTINLVKEYENVYATITVHHLLLTGDNLIGPPMNPHNFCMPILKSPLDKGQLQYTVLYSNESIFNKVMFGSDSAPHTIQHKECVEICPGCFTAPIALQLLAEIFMVVNKPERLQQFVSDNAKRIYNIDPPKKEITLERVPECVKSDYNGLGGRFTPIFSDQMIPWSIKI